MVKIERKDTDKTRQAIQSLEREKLKTSGKYNTDKVFEALREIFHEKCYICENKKAMSWEVEHLKPHRGDVELKFDWNNLFLSCAHCNHIKGSSYTPILDCTKVDVDEIISFRKIGYFGKDESLSFERLTTVNDSKEISMTCKLLKRVYYGKTPTEKFGAKVLRNAVINQLSIFKNYVREYREASGEDKKDLFCQIQRELKSNAPFAAFKRWIIRDNPDWCKDFIDCWKMSSVSP